MKYASTSMSDEASSSSVEEAISNDYLAAVPRMISRKIAGKSFVLGQLCATPNGRAFMKYSAAFGSARKMMAVLTAWLPVTDFGPPEPDPDAAEELSTGWYGARMSATSFTETS